MNYEQKYNEILEWARKNKARLNGVPIEEVLPELAETEDERIRKELVAYLKGELAPGQELIKQWLAYLEKQKEQKPADLSEMMVHKEPYIAPVPTPMVADEQKPAEWSDTKELVFKDICNHLKEEGYSGWVLLLNALRNGEFQPKQEWSEEDDEMRLEAIRVLVSGCERYRKESGCLPSWHKVINWLKSLPERFNLQTKPEVECDNETEIQKAYREGKNAGKKEVFDHPEEYGLQPRRMYDYETGKRNPEWSEEDEKTISDACCWIAEYAGYLMDKNYGKASMLMGLTEKLKSLRPSWKPSEEQMEALQNAVALTACDKELARLYNQLKKL